MITFTALNGSIQVGDKITMPVRLTKWERFLIWLASPFRWPPKKYDRNMTITIVNGTSFEVSE